MKIFLFAIVCTTYLSAFSQVEPGLLFSIKTATSAEITNIPLDQMEEGTLVYDSDQKSLLVFNDTEWVTIPNASEKTTISNELFFEDTNYYYISMSKNSSSWIVTRYSRANPNLEARATGTNAQPSTLADCVPLTYL